MAPRWLQLVGRKLGFFVRVGSDAAGNGYYEQHAWSGKLRRRLNDGRNPLDYNNETIPAQWMAWLSRTRSEPPTSC